MYDVRNLWKKGQITQARFYLLLKFEITSLKKISFQFARSLINLFLDIHVESMLNIVLITFRHVYFDRKLELEWSAFKSLQSKVNTSPLSFGTLQLRRTKRFGYFWRWIFLSSVSARHDTFALGCWKWWYCMRGTSSPAWCRCWNCEQIWQNSIRNCFWQTFHRYLWNVAGKLFLIACIINYLLCSPEWNFINVWRKKLKNVHDAQIDVKI